MTPALSLYLLACAVACVTDSRSRRIPNALTYGALGVALVFAAFRGPLAFGEAFALAVAVIVIGAFALQLGWFGGGDVKLIAAGAATIGLPGTLTFLAAVAIAGGVFAALTAWRDGRLQTVVLHVTSSIAARTSIVADPRARRVPYAFAICAGTCCYAATESIARWSALFH